MGIGWAAADVVVSSGRPRDPETAGSVAWDGFTAVLCARAVSAAEAPAIATRS